jgi:AraC-like DNA-binding protein
MDSGESFVGEGLRTLFDDFCSGFNVALTLYSSEGALLMSCPKRPALPFCRKVGGWLYGPAACAAQARRLRHLASDRGECLVYTCHAGMRCCAYPIRRGDRTLAVATIGDFRYAAEPSSQLLRDWQREVGRTDIILEDFRAVPLLAVETEKRMTRLFGVVVDHAISSGLISAGKSQLFERVIEYVRGHVAQPSIMIDEVAGFVNKSASTISHTVKKEAGISFKRLVIEQKLEAAEALMTSGPAPSIGEIAERIGYSDQFYFSRIYKKYRGFPPKEFTRRSVG